MKTYYGYRVPREDGRTPDASDEVVVLVTDHPTRENAKRLTHRIRHSPTGMNWGYGGSGPADLARSILWDHLEREPEPHLYQRFKEKFVSTWGRDWLITRDMISDWLTSMEREKYEAFGRRVATILDGVERGSDQLEKIGQVASALRIKLRSPGEVPSCTKCGTPYTDDELTCSPNATLCRACDANEQDRPTG